MAAKGLFLKECGLFLWTFSKGNPKDLKYTVTYFSEGSVFNADISDDQQTYYDYAKAAGWTFVTEFNQMQIFSTRVDNHVPFETDEQEKLNNIKKSIKKSLVPTRLALILVYILSLMIQFNSFQTRPIAYMADPTLAYLFYYLTYEISWLGIVIGITQVPILMFVFWSSIKYFKKKKASVKKNRLLSSILVVIVNFAFIVLITVLIIHFQFSADDSKYRTVDWQLTSTESHEYRLYKDEIPLKSQDLYGPSDQEYYSFKSDIHRTFLLGKSVYSQDWPPARNAPPEIEYEILQPQFDFVYQISKDHLLEIPEWHDNTSFEIIDNEIFNTEQAYQSYYDGNPTGEYILFFENRIIVLNMDDILTEEQVLVVKDKLEIR